MSRSIRRIAETTAYLALLSALLFAVGAPGGGDPHQVAIDPAAGPTYGWEGSYMGVNTANGNRVTAIPIVAWTARGGMPVDLSVYHSSQGNHNSELGQKWTFSYDIFLVIDISGNAT